VRYETVMTVMRKRHKNLRLSTGLRLLAACLLVALGFVGSAPAGAVTVKGLWSLADTREVRFTLGFDDPVLLALMQDPGPDPVETRELQIPLFTPSWITGTPATPGSDLVCLGLLAAEGMAYEEADATEGIATPVKIPEAGIGGVRYRYFYSGGKPRIIDCRLALALIRAAPVLRANGIVEVVFLNHYRPSFGRFKRGEYNFHSQGLAIDVWGFVTHSGIELVVRRDYETGLGFDDPHSCLGRPMTMKGMVLRKIACDLDASDAFKVILTPDYDAQHWHHYHFSAFHSQQRSLLRPRGTALLEVPITDLTAWALERSTRQRPELRRWDDVAARPWPEKHRWIHAKLGLPAAPTDAELAAQLLQTESPVGQIWTALAGFVDRLYPELEEATRETLDPALDELSQLIDEPAPHFQK
jgi:hypothetical protein